MASLQFDRFFSAIDFRPDCIILSYHSLIRSIINYYTLWSITNTFPEVGWTQIVGPTFYVTVLLMDGYNWKDACSKELVIGMIVCTVGFVLDTFIAIPRNDNEVYSIADLFTINVVIYLTLFVRSFREYSSREYSLRTLRDGGLMPAN